MASVKGTKTEENLMKAFSGESKARNKYTIYALQAKREGYDYIAKILEQIAENEKEHAKIWFKWMNDGNIPHTEENLNEAAQGENFEWTDMYSEFAQQAKADGLDHLAGMFEQVGRIEKSHEELFRKLILTLKNDVKSDDAGNFKWECSACGCTFEQKDEPDYCPLCENEDIFFFKRPM